MGSYKRIRISKLSIKKHKARFKKNKSKMGGLAAFAYCDCVGKNKKSLGRGMGLLH